MSAKDIWTGEGGGGGGNAGDPMLLQQVQPIVSVLFSRRKNCLN